MKKSIFLPASLACALIVAAAQTGNSQTITVPYTTNFDEFTPGGSVSPFVTTNASTASSAIVNLSGANDALQMTASNAGGGASTLNLVQANPNPFGVGTPFTLRATFTLDSFSDGTLSNVSINANADSGNANGYRLSYGVRGSVGTIFLTENGTTIGTTTLAGSITPASNLVFSLSLQGTYTSPTSLSLTGNLYNSSNALISTITYTDTSITTGDFFGVRAAVSSSAITATVTDFALVVPEPSTALLLTAGLGCTMIFRRRRTI